MEMKIEQCSQELVTEAVKTIPVSPRYSKVFMNAEGVSHFYGRSEGSHDYLAECKEKNVIPFSLMKFEYDLNSGLFVPKSDYHSFKPGVSLSSEESEAGSDKRRNDLSSSPTVHGAGRRQGGDGLFPKGHHA